MEKNKAKIYQTIGIKLKFVSLIILFSLKLTNQSGMSFYWEYEGMGDNARCVYTWGDNGVMEYRFEYGKGVTHVTNSLGHRESYYYDENNLIYKIVDASGGVTHQEYNAYQELVATTNPEGLTAKTVFNEYGKVTQSIDENGNATYFIYDSRLNLTDVYTAGGARQSWEYDHLGRVVQRTNAGGETFRYGYEGNQLKTVTDSQDNRIELEYNDRNDLVRLGYSNGLFRRWEYDDAGRLTLSEDVNGNFTYYKYDKTDNLVRLEEADGNVHDFDYDPSGNLIHAKDKLHEVAFTYGPMGVLKSRSQNGRTVSFGYDRELQLRRIVNEGREEYRFELDGLGQVVKETGFDGLQREYLRDGAGRVTKVIRPDGRWTEYRYDGVGNVIQEEHHDETKTLYAYNPDDLLLKAENENGIVELGRDRAGRIVSESFGGNSIGRQYDESGNCTQITSSLGADIRQEFDREGNLMKLQAGDSWQADWKRDKTGLELHRQLTGGVSVRTERDRFGRETRKSVGVLNIEQSGRQYQWGVGNRLQGIYDERTGKHTNFDYDAFDNLIKAEYQEQNKVETVYRAPDAIGNLFERKDRSDRKYDRGGRLTEDPNHYYYYDCEGNLIFKEFKQPQGFKPWGRAAIEKKFGIKFRATATGWYYKWNAAGMLMRVVNPQQGIINFGYDPLGRRTWKEAKGVRTNWLWDGNVPLHEWKTTKQEPLIDIITWVFEDGTFVPTARITDRGSESIVTDYLGTPIEAYNEDGTKVWEREIDIYGRIRKENLTNFVPFLYQGQYFDADISLCYNRFRWYDQSIGSYISQDPTSIAGGLNLYSYVKDTNIWVDMFGLSGCDTAKLRAHANAAKAEAQLSPRQQASIKRSMDRASAATDPKMKAYHEMMAGKKEQLYMGTQIDTRFKAKVEADPDLAHLSTTPRGQFGPDVYDPKTKQYWDLTTEKDWGKGTHQSKYDKDFGSGTGIFW